MNWDNISVRESSKNRLDGKSSLYREVQLDFTPEIKVSFMLFERCPTKIRKKYLKQHMKYSTSISGLKFSWTTL